MPNTLDFDVVFTELQRVDETGNVAVLSAIIFVLLLFLLVVIFARKADKQDKLKVQENCSVYVIMSWSWQATLKLCCMALPFGNLKPNQKYHLMGIFWSLI